MASLNILGSDLLKGLSYVASAVGTKTASKQESTLVYLAADPAEDTAILQVQSTMFIASIRINYDNIDSDEKLEALLDYNALHNYVRNNSKTSLFEFDFSEIDKDVLTLNIGSKFIGEMITFPINAYELESFEDTSLLTTITASKFKRMIDMSCQFANVKQDTQDYMQLVGEEDRLIFFTSDSDVVAKFSSDESLDDDFDVTVKASALRSIKSFEQESINLLLDDEGYYLIIQEDIGFRAVALHSDPPQSYKELNEEDSTYDYTLSWSIEEMQQALRNLESTTSDGKLLFNIMNDYTLKVSSNNLDLSSTKIELNAIIDNFEDKLSKEDYTCGIGLFRKLGNVAKKSGKVNLEFSLNEEDPKDIYVQYMEAIGTEHNIDYNITFGIVD
jgi:DNA polymerase III sliding clamp (beta) subunit (PCNA family)|tara:strand:- start:3693 stop:4856 length:1164 start_codon:yes stop_codon:yes gene_type:complete